MCTVSWLHHETGFELLCNRDEKLTRKPAAAPCVQRRGGMRFLTPVDGDHGGSWITANEHGVALCLLNGANLGGASTPASKAAGPSRGLILLQLAAAPSAMAACEQLARMDLLQTPPFTLVALEPGLPASVAEWNGTELAILPNADPFMPLISSSFDTHAVQRQRRTEFALRTRARLDAPSLYRFHESHGSGASAYTPCMHRPGAQTVSFSWVKVDDRSIEFFYSPAAPCQWQPGQTLRLERRA
ncbi:NRDE family protein [Paludibaculum fermentans]|uniref:NRDE family protein n=1 Tax=Paludibaculum fermentans TaxID=1473598 RepID=UPI003EBA6DDF